MRGKYYGCYQLQGGAWKVLFFLSATGQCVESTMAAISYRMVRRKYYCCSATGWCVESTMAAISYRVVHGKYYGCYQLPGGAWKLLWLYTQYTGRCVKYTMTALSYRVLRQIYYDCAQLQAGV